MANRKLGQYKMSLHAVDGKQQFFVREELRTQLLEENTALSLGPLLEILVATFDFVLQAGGGAMGIGKDQSTGKR
jgi:hypothetical protein